MERLPRFIKVVVGDIKNSNHYVLQTIVQGNRTELIKYLIANGVETRIRHDFLIPNLTPFLQDPRLDLDRAEVLVNQTLCLPLHNKMSTEDVKYICDLICNFYEE